MVAGAIIFQYNSPTAAFNFLPLSVDALDQFDSEAQTARPVILTEIEEMKDQPVHLATAARQRSAYGCAKDMFEAYLMLVMREIQSFRF
jgi:hypothetical protein